MTFLTFLFKTKYRFIKMLFCKRLLSAFLVWVQINSRVFIWLFMIVFPWIMNLILLFLLLLHNTELKKTKNKRISCDTQNLCPCIMFCITPKEEHHCSCTLRMWWDYLKVSCTYCPGSQSVSSQCPDTTKPHNSPYLTLQTLMSNRAEIHVKGLASLFIQ